MVKRSALIAALFISISQPALSKAAEWETLTVEGKPLSITTSALSGYVDALSSVSSSLETCSNKLEKQIAHPLTERKSQFILSPVGGVCRFIWNRDMRWRYTCTLSPEDREGMHQAFSGWISTQKGLGDFSEPLKKLLFNTQLCVAERI